MPKLEWGRKIRCQIESCETKFYDLNRKPPICPKCGAEYEELNSPVVTNASKQVFNDNLNVSSDSNLVGSDPSESIAEVEDISIDDAMDDDTISLEENEDSVEVEVIDDEVEDLSIENNDNENIED